MAAINTGSASNQTSTTGQQGSSTSLGFAGSQNGNTAGASGGSSASTGLLGGWQLDDVLRGMVDQSYALLLASLTKQQHAQVTGA